MQHEYGVNTGMCPRAEAASKAMLSLRHCSHSDSTRLCAEQQPRCIPTMPSWLSYLYIFTVPERARAAFDSTTGAVAVRRGIASNLGKTRVHATEAGAPPPGISKLGDAVWRGNKPPRLEKRRRRCRHACRKNAGSCNSCCCSRTCSAVGWHRIFCNRKNGATALPGALSCKPNPGRRCMPRGLATWLADARFAHMQPPLSRTLRRFCGPRPSHRRAFGSLRSQQSGPQRYPTNTCRDANRIATPVALPLRGRPMGAAQLSMR